MIDPKYKDRPTDILFVDAKPTPLSREELAFYLKKAWKKVFNEDITRKQLSIIWAHTCLETGNTKEMKNFNFGNIKKLKDINWTSYQCSEVLKDPDGVKRNHIFYPYHPQTFFAAWLSPEEGTEEFIKFLTKPKYAKALAALKDGNTVRYMEELSKVPYFTASLIPYTQTQINLERDFNRKADYYWNWKPAEPEVIIDFADEEVEELTPPSTSVILPPPMETKPPYETTTIVKKSEEKKSLIQIVWEYIFWYIQMFLNKKKEDNK